MHAYGHIPMYTCMTTIHMCVHVTMWMNTHATTHTMYMCMYICACTYMRVLMCARIASARSCLTSDNARRMSLVALCGAPVVGHTSPERCLHLGTCGVVVRGVFGRRLLPDAPRCMGVFLVRSWLTGDSLASTCGRHCLHLGRAPRTVDTRVQMSHFRAEATTILQEGRANPIHSEF